MKYKSFLKFITLSLVVSFSISTFYAQKNKQTIVFAVINGGKTIEPIATLSKNKLFKPVGGDESFAKKKVFVNTYYKAKSKYNLIFAGKIAGSVNILKANPESDCSSNMAEVSTVSDKAKLSDRVLGLATNKSLTTQNGIRRMPTRKERIQIESLVRRELVKNKIPKRKTINLKYLNLTALDLDKGKAVEFVGSFFAEVSKTERAILFFIAEKSRAGYYYLNKSNFSRVKQKDLMNEDIKTVDSGVYHELLLDVMDYNGDGIKEVFTMVQGFEGNTFTVYGRKKGKWYKTFEFSNYHCGF